LPGKPLCFLNLRTKKSGYLLYLIQGKIPTNSKPIYKKTSDSGLKKARSFISNTTFQAPNSYYFIGNFKVDGQLYSVSSEFQPQTTYPGGATENRDPTFQLSSLHFPLSTNFNLQPTT